MTRRRWEEQDKKEKQQQKKGGGALNLWLTESCEGTLKSPKSLELGHTASAFVTLMLRNIADAVKTGSQGGNKKTKKTNWVADSSHDYCWQTLSHMKCQGEEKKKHGTDTTARA